MTLETLAGLSVLVFVLASMVSMGLSFGPADVVRPLARPRVVIVALALNFVLASALALAITRLFSLDPELRLGLVLLGAAAGAPIVPKLVQIARGDLATGVALMVLLTLASVVYMPLALPLILPDVAVDPWQIARPLIVVMLLPLGIAMAVRARSATAAAIGLKVAPALANLALVVAVILGAILHLDVVADMFGSFGIVAAFLFVGGLTAAGFLLGGSGTPGQRSALGLATGQRNISAALIVASENFGLEVVTYVLVASVAGGVVLFGTAGVLGRRAGAAG